MNKRTIIFISLSISIILAITLAYIIMKRFTPVVLYVEPQTIQGAIGQNFTININISNVIDLYGWSFKLSWETTILEVVNVTEGAFLRSGGDTFFIPKINNTAGHITADCTLLGNVPGVSGNGLLATIEFHVKDGGACDLILYETMLINSAEQSVVHTVVNGYFNSVS